MRRRLKSDLSEGRAPATNARIASLPTREQNRKRPDVVDRVHVYGHCEVRRATDIVMGVGVGVSIADLVHPRWFTQSLQGKTPTS